MIGAMASALQSSPDWTELHDDGDTTEHLGKLYRLRVTYDESGLDMWSDDCYGLVSPAYDYIRDSHAPRLDGMNGSAEKLQIDRGLWVWWQAPADVKRGTEQWTKLRSMVRDILEYGFQLVGLEECDGTRDAYGHLVVTRAAWLGGLEPMDYTAWSETLTAWLLPELFAELA